MAVFKTTVENLSENLQALQEIDLVRFSQGVVLVIDTMKKALVSNLPIRIVISKPTNEVILVIDRNDYINSHQDVKGLEQLSSPMLGGRVLFNELAFPLPVVFMPSQPQFMMQQPRWAEPIQGFPQPAVAPAGFQQPFAAPPGFQQRQQPGTAWMAQPIKPFTNPIQAFGEEIENIMQGIKTRLAAEDQKNKES